MTTLKLLLIADIHYSGAKDNSGITPRERKTTYGCEFLDRIRTALLREGMPDGIVLLGDVINDGTDSRALNDLKQVKQKLDEFGIPLISLPGNHDGDYKRFFTVFSKQTGPNFLKDYILFIFADQYQKGDFAYRNRQDLELLSKTRKKHPDKKIIVLQHNPVQPEIASEYPFNLVNAAETSDVYRRNKVLLSISGHYHPGIPELTRKNNVAYLTAPALCEAPFSYLLLRITENRISVSQKRLKNDDGLADNHCHTEFAYCGEDVTIKTVIERAKLFGLERVCFTEHAGQLYLSEKDYWSGRYFHEPSLLRNKADNRMDAYRRKVLKARSPFSRFGLEVEIDKNGKMTLLPDDANGWDLLVGAVHYLPPEAINGSARQLQRAFLRTCESLLENGVDVLAHPFRFFRRGGLPVPKELYRPLAGMLKNFGAAAELNFHTNQPDPRFFQTCLDEGVKISLATDSHNLLEAGDLRPHLDFLKRLRIKNLETVLWNPPARKR